MAYKASSFITTPRRLLFSNCVSMLNPRVKTVLHMTLIIPKAVTLQAGAQFEGDLREILALGAEISPYIGLREKWESP